MIDLQTKRAGLTLVELLITIALLSLVLLVVYFYSRYWQESFILGFDRSQATSDAFRIAGSIATELREMEPGENGEYALAQADDQAITFYADGDHNGIVERIRYYIQEKTIWRGEIAPSGSPLVYDPLSEEMTVITEQAANTSLPLFRYYNTEWPVNTIDNPLMSERELQTRFIEVSIAIQQEGNQDREPIIASQGAHLRTLKSNY